MKRSLLFIIVAIFSILTAAESFAQSGADTILSRTVYTTSDRLAILAKTVTVNKVDVLFQSGTDGKGNPVTVKNLAVLASSADGKSLLISGKFIFNTNNLSVDSAWVIARIDSPFTNIGGQIRIFSKPVTIGGAKILRYFSIDENQSLFHFPADKMMPLGVLTPDGNSWYATLSKVSGGSGNQWFFHGSFDGKSPVDSLFVDPNDPTIGDAAAISGYHMSNLTTNEDGSTMLAFVFDQINSDKPRAQLFRWTPGASVGTFGFFADKINVPNFRLGGNIDTCFGFLFRVKPNQLNPTAEIALAPNTTGDLTMYSFRYDAGSAITLSADNSRKIPRSILGDANTGLHFFTGVTNSPQTPDDGREVITPSEGAPNGNGGDMMFSPGGDSIIFVTCGHNDFASPAASEIAIYDIPQAQLTLVQNDLLAMERQPIFTANVIHKFKAPPPPPYQPGKAIIDKPSIDFGSNFIGDPNATATVTLKDTTSSLVIVNQAMISGPDAGIFSVIPSIPPSPSQTVAGLGSLPFSVSFAPAAVQTYNDTLIIHYQDSLKKGIKDSIFVIPLTGNGVKKTSGGVANSSPASFDLSIMPNPFTASTKITVTAREAGSTSLEIRDLLGKNIYSSKTLSLGSGEKFNYTFDANALHLIPEAYFVIVRSGVEEMTRQVIYVK